MLSVIFLAGLMLGFARPASAQTTPVALSTLNAGDTVSFAGYTWIVLDNGATSGSSYLLMADALKDSGGNYITMMFDLTMQIRLLIIPPALPAILTVMPVLIF